MLTIPLHKQLLVAMSLTAALALAQLAAMSVPGNGNGNSGDTTSGDTTSSNNDHAPANGYVGPLSNFRPGDTVTFYINSQTYKNAAWTSLSQPSANANWLNNAIAQSLDLAETQPGYIPSVKVGDPLYMINGVAGQKKLAETAYLTALRNKKVIFLPVMAGDPPYNQSRTCIGFVAVRVTDIRLSSGGGEVESIDCKILRALGPGTGGNIASTGNTQTDTALKALAPGPIKMLH